MSSVVLTHWDGDAFPFTGTPDQVASQVLSELVFACLLNEHVLIKDVDLAMTPEIQHIVTHPRHSQVLRELCESGALVLNRMPADHYQDDDLRQQSAIHPLLSRAMNLQRNSTLRSAKWIMPPDLRNVCDIVDGWVAGGVLRARFQVGVISIAETFPREFAATMGAADTLENRDDYPGLTKETLRAFEQFALDPERANDVLRRRGLLEREQQQFTRSLLYQLTELEEYRREQASLRSLGQSIFASVYCASENAEGRWGEKLPERPLLGPRITGPTHERIIYEPVLTSPVALGPGIGLAVKTARDTDAFVELVRALNGRQVGSSLRKTFEGVVRVFVDALPAAPEKSILAGPVWVFAEAASVAAGTLGLVLQQRGADQPAVLGSGAAALFIRAAKVTDELVSWLADQRWRTRLTHRYSDVLSVRYARIPLLTIPPADAPTLREQTDPS